MSDDSTVRRTGEPAPTADPAAVGEPAVVTSREEVRVSAVPHAPAESADDAGPAHRADEPVEDAAGAPPASGDRREEAAAVPVSQDRDSAGASEDRTGDSGVRPGPADADRAADAVGSADQPSSEDRIGGPAAAVPADTRLDPRPEGGGWVTAEPPAVAEEGQRPVTVAGPDSAAADSVDRPDPGAEILPDALPPVDARHGSGEDRDSAGAVPAGSRSDTGEQDHGRPEQAAIAEEARDTEQDRPLSPAEQPTTEAPRLAQARAEALRAQQDRKPEETSIHEPRPEESREVPAVSAPAVTPAAPPVPAPTTPVQQTGEQPVAAPPAPVPVYLESPVPPKKKGNRGFGILMSLLAALAYALVWAGVAALIIALNTTGDRVVESLTSFLASPVYWGPIIVFALGMIVLSLIVNRGGWAWWLIGGFLAAVAVYFGYLGSGLLTVAQQLTPNDVPGFIGSIAASPLAIASAVVAREVSIWFGLATSARGKKVKARNAEARQNYERESAERRAEYDRARAGIADPSKS
ncbi:hypothetical protein [Naasia sp. SYSU D00948]|uniref:hypothetical protein n=1 Tax=Naasia sp. SYSU D00948 TaxID=2817379 RepID=UPI001B3150D9|nr:hypothetical protein [Naasia sp. SYSU D00948]